MVLWICSDMNEIREGEQTFELFHISTLIGSAPKDFKKILTSIWNTDIGKLYQNLKPIERRFNLEYRGRLDMFYEHKIAFIDKQTDEYLVLKASKFRECSLKKLAAAKVSSELGGITDVTSIIQQALIPIHLQDVLLKYL